MIGNGNGPRKEPTHVRRKHSRRGEGRRRSSPGRSIRASASATPTSRSPTSSGRSPSIAASSASQLKARYGKDAAFIAAGDYHHHIGLNTWESKGGHPPPPGTTGLYHHAILYPSRAALADALRRLIAAGIPLTGASDHGVSEALYLDDPDGIGVELYRDRPQAEWPANPDGSLAMFTKRLDLENLLREGA